jgi:hypothetical protein
VREYRIEAEHGSWARNPDDHLPVFLAAGRQFEISAADEIKAARVFALREKGSLRGKRNGAGGQFEIGQDGAAQ